MYYNNKINVSGLKNEENVRGKSRTEKSEKEDKIGQKSDYFIKCYQRLTSYTFILFEP